MKPWKTLEKVTTKEGELQLRQRGDEFVILIDGRVLMPSSERLSEEALARLACEPLAKLVTPRVLIGGLGMGFTLRAALDALPPRAEVVVAELTATVEAWCRGPLAVLTNGAVLDARTRVVIDDVSRVIAATPHGHYDAIILDLYEGPHATNQWPDDHLYGQAALRRCHAALVSKGILAIWSEESNAAFEKRFRAAGFEVTVDRSGRSRSNCVYLGRKR